MTRHARRTDSTQTDIVNGLRGVGWKVTVMSGVGFGVPDIRATKPTLGIWFDAKSTSDPVVRRSQIKFAEMCPESYFVAALTPDYAIQMAQRIWSGRTTLRGAWHLEPGVKLES